MPAVTPAEVQTWPSRTKMRSSSTSTSGYSRAMMSHTDQCVVARRPSSSPAAARISAPLHTDVTRRLRSVAPRSQSSRSASTMAAAVPVAAGHDEGVDRRVVVGDRGVGHQPEARRGADLDARRSTAP